MLCRRYKIVCFFSFTRHPTDCSVKIRTKTSSGCAIGAQFTYRLLLNPEKTKLIVFGSQQMTSKLHEFRLSLLGKDISPVQSAKDLGVILDSNLTFDAPSQPPPFSMPSKLRHCTVKRNLIVLRSVVFMKLCLIIFSSFTVISVHLTCSE